MRVLNGRRTHEWITDSGAGEGLWFKAKGTPIVGEIYRVEVTRTGERTTRHGQPRYAGDGRADAALVARWWVEHRAAEGELALQRMQRAAARHDPLAEAFAPLLALAGSLRTYAAREALIAYVVRELGGVPIRRTTGR